MILSRGVDLDMNVMVNKNKRHAVISDYFNIKNKHFLLFLVIHRNPEQKELSNCYDYFFRAALTGYGHPSPF